MAYFQSEFSVDTSIAHSIHSLFLYFFVSIKFQIQQNKQKNKIKQSTMENGRTVLILLLLLLLEGNITCTVHSQKIFLCCLQPNYLVNCLGKNAPTHTQTESLMSTVQVLFGCAGRGNWDVRAYTSEYQTYEANCVRRHWLVSEATCCRPIGHRCIFLNVFSSSGFCLYWLARVIINGPEIDGCCLE